MSIQLVHLDTDNPAQVCISNEVNEYLNASISSNTWRAYRDDLKHFRAWGGEFPATPEQVAALNEGFTPSSDYLKQANGTIQSFEKAGTPTAKIDNQVFDEYKIERLKDILSQSIEYQAFDVEKSKTLEVK